MLNHEIPNAKSDHHTTTQCAPNHEFFGADGNNGAGVGRGADGDGRSARHVGSNSALARMGA